MAVRDLAALWDLLMTFPEGILRAHLPKNHGQFLDISDSEMLV
jgi:hypothetical protein